MEALYGFNLVFWRCTWGWHKLSSANTDLSLLNHIKDLGDTLLFRIVRIWKSVPRGWLSQIISMHLSWNLIIFSPCFPSSRLVVNIGLIFRKKRPDLKCPRPKNSGLICWVPLALVFAHSSIECWDLWFFVFPILFFNPIPFLEGECNIHMDIS